MSAMCAGNYFKRCALGKKYRTLGRLECRLSGLVNILFFCPFIMVYFSNFVLSSVFLDLVVTLWILFIVSPHKNIKKTINMVVLAENVLGANGKIGNIIQAAYATVL